MSRPPEADAVVWHGSPADGGTEAGVAAWVFSLREAAAFVGLAPTGRDLADRGARTGADADRFLLRRAILRRLVARRVGVSPASVAIGYDAAGAPRVLSPGPPLFCSVAARGTLTALAIAARPVGIDVEPLEAGDIPFAVLSAQEAADLRSLPSPERLRGFLHIWTLKEAHAKAGGTGLPQDPAEISVSLRDRSLADGADRYRLPASVWHAGEAAGRRFVAACVTRAR